MIVTHEISTSGFCQSFYLREREGNQRQRELASACIIGVTEKAAEPSRCYSGWQHQHVKKRTRVQSTNEIFQLRRSNSVSHMRNSTLNWVGIEVIEIETGVCLFGKLWSSNIDGRLYYNILWHTQNRNLMWRQEEMTEVIPNRSIDKMLRTYTMYEHIPLNYLSKIQRSRTCTVLISRCKFWKSSNSLH